MKGRYTTCARHGGVRWAAGHVCAHTGGNAFSLAEARSGGRRPPPPTAPRGPSTPIPRPCPFPPCHADPTTPWGRRRHNYSRIGRNTAPLAHEKGWRPPRGSSGRNSSFAGTTNGHLADDRAAHRFAEGGGSVLRASTDPGDVFGTPLGDILAGATPFPNYLSGCAHNACWTLISSARSMRRCLGHKEVDQGIPTAPRPVRTPYRMPWRRRPCVGRLGRPGGRLQQRTARAIRDAAAAQRARAASQPGVRPLWSFLRWLMHGGGRPGGLCVA